MLGRKYDLGDNGWSQQGLKCAGFPGHLLTGRFENQFIHGRKIAYCHQSLIIKHTEL